MGIFAGVEKAEVYGGGQKIRPGLHRLKISEVLIHNSQKRRGTQFFIVEFEVVESMGGRPVSVVSDEGTTSTLHSPGDRVSWLQDMSQTPALSNVKGFALALAPDAKNEDITEESLDMLVSSSQPAVGIEVMADATVLETQSTGRDFTRIRWAAVQ